MNDLLPTTWSSDDVQALRIRRDTNNDHVLYYHATPVTTPAGHRVGHRRREIAHAVLNEAWINGGLDITNGQYFSLFATQHDLLAEGFAQFVEQMPHLLIAHEVTTQLSPGPEQIDQRWAWRSVEAWLNEHGLTLLKVELRFDARLVALVSDTLLALHPAQQSAVMTLYFRHRMSVLLALMVVWGRCTADEYVLGSLVNTTAYPPNGLDADAIAVFADTALEWVREVQVACTYCTMMMRPE